MKEIIFVTGNDNKAREAKDILGIDIERQKIDLPEIQSITLKPVLKEKLKEAYNILQRPVMVEDVGLFIESFNGLPGALIKWFMEGPGRDGVNKMLSPYENKKATAVCGVGYTDDGENLHIFEGAIDGIIVPKRGESGFGFDPIFQPIGYDQTFAEMGEEKKNSISHRYLALQKFKKFLENE